MTFSTGGSTFDTQLAAYRVTGSPAIENLQLPAVAENDDAGQNYCDQTEGPALFSAAFVPPPKDGIQSEITFAPEAGKTYFLVVRSWEGAGPYTLSWTTSANDAFPGTAISDPVGTDVANDSTATAEDGEPAHGEFGPERSLWWSWTAPSNGRVTFDTSESTVSADALAVYTGDSLPSLELVNRAGSDGLVLAHLSFRATAGTVYRVAVDSSAETDQLGGDIVLAWRMVPNDDFADAQDLGSASSGSVDGDDTGASAEPGEPGKPNTSVWYHWVAPSAHTVTFSVPDGFVVGVFQGESVDALTAIANSGTPNAFVFDPETGGEYFVAVDSSEPGPFTLEWHSAPPNDTFDEAQLIEGPSGSVAGTTQDAQDVNEPSPAVWYGWLAPSSDLVRFRVLPDGPEQTLYVFNVGVQPAPVELDRTGAFHPAPGQPYAVVVAAGESGPGPFTLVWDTTPRPPNDDYANAHDLGGAPNGSVDGTVDGATREEGDPQAGNGQTVWYRWTAPSGDDYTFDAGGSSFAAFLQIYDASGTALGGGERPAPSAATFRPQPGETYWIVVDTLDGSGPLRLDWSTPSPVVTGQPSPQTVTEGTLVAFAAAAEGTPTPDVRWQVSTDGGTSFEDIPGATASEYVFTACGCDDGKLFRAVFSNEAGAAKSDPALLTVLSAPFVTQNPSDESVVEGDDVTFTASASGNPAPSVQWEVARGGGDVYEPIPDATEPTLSFQASLADDGNAYRAVFSNEQGQPVASDAARLTVTPATRPPSVTDEPDDVTVLAGDGASFTAAADGVPAPSVQWQVSVGGGDFVDLDGATSETLELTAQAADDGNRYRAVFDNGVGAAATSGPALLTVHTAPEVTTQPEDATAEPGAPVQFTADASGNPAPSVQWQVSTDGGTSFADLPGATAETLDVTASEAADGNLYHAVFTNPVTTATTRDALLTVQSAPVVTEDPADAAVSVGGEASFHAAADGYPAPAVQWQVDSGGGFADMPGETSATLTVGASADADGNRYRAIFSNRAGDAPTAPATLTILTPPTITSSPEDQTVVAGQEAQFSAAATGNPQPDVRWQVSVGGGPFADLEGEIAPTLVVATTRGDDGNRYRAVFTNSEDTVESAPALLTVQAPPLVTADPVDTAVPSGGIAHFSASAIGNPTPTVVWLVSSDGETFVPLPGETGPALDVAATPANDGNLYRARFTNSVTSVDSVAARLTVQTAPVVTTHPADQSVPQGQVAHFTAAATGTPPPIVQWQVASPGAPFADLPGETGPTLDVTAGPETDGKRYQAVFTNVVGSATTDAATLTVLTAPVVTTQPEDQTVAAGETAHFAAAATARPTPTVRWQVSTNGGDTWSDVPGATATSLIVTPAFADDGNRYRAVFSNSVAANVASDSALLTVTRPAVSVTPTSLSVDEPATGSADARLAVSLTRASLQTVTVDYATEPGSAAAGDDYTTTSGTLEFAPGETTKTVDVPVLADAANEFDQTFSLRLSNPTNAALDIDHDVSQVTIVDHPPGAGPHAVAYTPGCRANVLPRNDDGSTGAVALPFQIDFFGSTYSSLYVNNNGDVTFNGPFGDYDASELDLAHTVIIAPFFSDVDTRNPASDVVTYGATTYQGATAFCVLWAHIGVGYYSQGADRLNSFQLLLVDRGAGNFDIVFNYDQVQWDTTGTSEGVAARIGYSNGAGSSLELPGSGGPGGSLVDSAPGALTAGSRNSGGQLGRYVFAVRQGVPEGSATISGVVRDGSASGTVPDAQVAACPVADGECKTATSGSGGAYSIDGLSSGDYTVRAFPPSGSPLLPGQRPTTVDSVLVTGQDVTLQSPQPPPPGVTITPSANRASGIPLVDPRQSLTLAVDGCPGGSATYRITQGEATLANGPLAETSAGHYTATVPALNAAGLVHVSLQVACPGARTVAAVSGDAGFDLVVLPGRVTAPNGTTGIAGATVTLLRSDTAGGTFDPVPNGSSLLSSLNRTNPDTTTQLGAFGWDAFPGFYRVRAEKTGCTAAGSSAPFAETGTIAVTSSSSLVSQLGAADLRLACGSAPTVTQQPASQDVAAGQQATFTATATGTGANGQQSVSVQWQVKRPGAADFAAIAGATSTTLTVTVAATDDGSLYRAVFTNGAGTATSAAATLTVQTAPTISTQPAAATVTEGAHAQFTASADGRPAPTVRWQVSTDGATFSDIPGATDSTLDFATVSGDTGKLYRAVFTNAAGAATTNAAQLTVQAAAAPTTTTAANLALEGADISVSASASPSLVVQGSAVTFSIGVANSGPDDATGVSVSVQLGPGLAFASASAGCSGGGSVSCGIGDLAAGASASVSVTARTTATGILGATASAGGSGTDPDGGNNSASASVNVAIQPPPAPPVNPPPPPILPPPVLGELVNAQPVTGTIFVNGEPFVSPKQLQVGAVVDVRNGSIQLVTEKDTAIFYGGVFTIAQQDAEDGTTDLVLRGGDFSQCGPRTTSGRSVSMVTAKSKKKVIRQLFGSGHGRFRTQARYSSATVRGTIWVTQDLCDGSLTTVNRGLVAVHDDTVGHTVYVPAGYSYLAPAG